MSPPTKRRKTNSATAEEIVFDPEARQDYLTGFHKRKLQRAKHAKEVAEKKAQAERIEERRKEIQLREERKQELDRHIAEVNALIKPVEQLEEVASASEDDEQEWNGLAEPPEVDHEAEYVDEDRYTTVTVEAMDLSKDGLHKQEETQADLDSSEERQLDGATRTNDPKQGKRIWTKDKPEKDARRPKKKRKKFRYENKAERKLTRIKEKSKNSRQAKARRSG